MPVDRTRATNRLSGSEAGSAGRFFGWRGLARVLALLEAALRRPGRRPLLARSRTPAFLDAELRGLGGLVVRAAGEPGPHEQQNDERDLPQFSTTPAPAAIEKCPRKIILRTPTFPEALIPAPVAAEEVTEEPSA